MLELDVNMAISVSLEDVSMMIITETDAKEKNIMTIAWAIQIANEDFSVILHRINV